MSNVVNKLLGGGSAPATVETASAPTAQQEFGTIKTARKRRPGGRSLLFSRDEGEKSTTLG